MKRIYIGVSAISFNFSAYVVGNTAFRQGGNAAAAAVLAAAGAGAGAVELVVNTSIT